MTITVTKRESTVRNDLDAVERVELYGPAPINPFKQLRINLGESLNRLAVLARVDRKALTRLESGMYTQPLPSMIDFWVNRGVITEGDLVTKYEDYQLTQRQRHEFYFGPTLYFDLEGIHPLRQLRATRPSLVDNDPLPVGITECAENLCIPLDTLQFFEKKYRLQQSVPKPFKHVLNQIGYTRDQINTFEANYKKWRTLQSKVTVL